MIWEPKTLCLCATLRTGTLVLGWLGVIGSALPLLLLLGFAGIPRGELLGMCSRGSLPHESPDLASSRLNPDPIYCANAIQGVLAFYGIIEGITLIICILLLIGVDKNIPCLMLPYLIGRGIYIVLLTLLGLIGFIGLCINGLVWPAFYNFIVFGGISFLSVYFFLVVRTYHKEVKQRGHSVECNTDIVYVEQVNLN